MSMMRSNITSVKSTAKVASLVVSKLSGRQVLATGDHVERSYGCQVSQACLKQSKLEIHPYDACDSAPLKRFSHDLYEVLTIDDKCDVCQPYAHCDCNNNLLPVPNGDSVHLP